MRWKVRRARLIRLLALILLIFGVFDVAFGLQLRFYNHPRIALVPLDPQAVLVLHGSATVLDPTTLKTRHNIAIIATVRIQGRLDAAEAPINGSRSVAVWHVHQVINDAAGASLDASEQVICVDRRTATAVQPCPEQEVNNNPSGPVTGLQLRFPFNTGQHDYAFDDPIARGALPIRYADTEFLDGLPVYRFVQTTPAMKLGNTDVPDRLAGGRTNKRVHAVRVYEEVRTLWVEPYTGQVVRTWDVSHVFLEGPEGRNGQALLQTSLGTTVEAVHAFVSTAKAQRAQARQLYDRGPKLLICLGGGFFQTGLACLATKGPPRRYLIRRWIRLPKHTNILGYRAF